MTNLGTKLIRTRKDELIIAHLTELGHAMREL